MSHGNSIDQLYACQANGVLKAGANSARNASEEELEASVPAEWIEFGFHVELCRPFEAVCLRFFKERDRLRLVAESHVHESGIGGRHETNAGLRFELGERALRFGRAPRAAEGVTQHREVA